MGPVGRLLLETGSISRLLPESNFRYISSWEGYFLLDGETRQDVQTYKFSLPRGGISCFLGTENWRSMEANDLHEDSEVNPDESYKVAA